MRFARLALVAVVALLIGAYSFDCEALKTPEQAMQCCGSMPCPPHGHDGQDCCNTIPTLHAPFVKPSAVQGVSFHLTVAALLRVRQLRFASCSERMTATVSHAPPICSRPTTSPLRI